VNDQAIEQEIQAKGLTAPRITPADLKANIVGEYFFTAADGVQAAFHSQDELTRLTGAHGGLSLLTFCVLVLRNGFTVTGESACASPENFDADIGRKIARENAVAKVWPLMGYALKQSLFERSKAHSQEDAFQHFLSYSGGHSLPEDVQLKMWDAFQAAYPA